MISNSITDRHFAPQPWFSVAIYVALVVVLGLITLFFLMDIAERFSAHNASLDLLARIKERAQMQSLDLTSPAWPPGSPVLEGQTATVASAALLRRITSAVTQVGGNIVSTEVESQGAPSKDGYLKVLVTSDIEQSALQQMLYDLEAGMPFLFVDHLVIQTPTMPSEGERIHVIIGVSGLWRGEK